MREATLRASIFYEVTGAEKAENAIGEIEADGLSAGDQVEINGVAVTAAFVGTDMVILRSETPGDIRQIAQYPGWELI